MLFDASMSRESIVIIPVLIFLCSVTISAKESVTWNDCLEVASKSNPDIQSAKSTLSSSEYKAKAAYSNFLPQVTGNVNYNSGDFSAGSSGSFSTSTSSASVMASQNLFAGFHDKANIDQTAANRDANVASLNNVKVQVSFDLKLAYASLLYAQDYSRLGDEIIKRRKENADLVNLRFEGGMENKGSLLLSNAFLGQAKYEKLQADHSIESASQQLAKVLGTDDSKRMKISGKIPISVPPKDPNFDEIALATPDYQQKIAKEKAAKAGVLLATSSFLPTVDLSATASKQGSNWPPNNDNTTVSVNVGVPIFNGANNYFTLRSSKSDHAAAKYNRTSSEYLQLSKLKQTYMDFLDAIQKLEVDKNFLEAATVRAEIARNRYKNGLINFDDWDIIENDLITKQKTVLQSEKQLYLAEAAWVQAMGKGVLP